MFMPSTVAYFNRSGQSGGEGGVGPLTTPKWLTDRHFNFPPGALMALLTCYSKRSVTRKPSYKKNSASDSGM